VQLDPGYTVTGPDAGPPIVFVHGTRLTRAMWVAQAARLGGEFRVVSVDLPGHGTRAGESFRLADAADSVAETIDLAAGGRAIVVGLSLGGFVGMELVARHPNRVAGLVVAGASGDPRGALGASCLALAFAMRRGDHRRLVALNSRFFRFRYPPEIAEPILRGGFWFKAGSDALLSIIGRRFRPRLAAFDGPTLIVNGRFDWPFRPTERSFVAAAQRGSLIVLPGATHLANLDRPDAFSGCVARFSRLVAGLPGGESEARPEPARRFGG
jgi:pimeloyl-ACP methyl ester carboxylesterase